MAENDGRFKPGHKNGIQKGRHMPALADLAAKEGYTPARFTMRRLAAISALIEGQLKAIEEGLHPEGLEHMHPEKAKALVFREAADLMQNELKWAGFFYPQMKSTESKVQMDGELSLLDLLNRAREADDAESGESG